jgi:phosphate starvation-inducible PhoH-like protein
MEGQNKMLTNTRSLVTKIAQVRRTPLSVQCKQQVLREKKVPRVLTPNQQKYLEYLACPDVPLVVGIGKAGSGKTLLASTRAIESFYSKQVSKIVITRPAVYLDEEHGFLPGNLEEKMQPWLRPIYDCFLEYYSMETIKALIKEELIEICPLAYIRGRTFNNAFIIADEMQNTTMNQMKTFLTRLGKDTKAVITGDLEQCDLDSKVNGLRHFLDQLALHNRRLAIQGSPNGQESIKVVEFMEEDIQRSEIVRTVLTIYKENPIDQLFM